MIDWKAGDKAICLKTASARCCDITVEKGRYYEVADVAIARNGDLHLKVSDDIECRLHTDHMWWHVRFAKLEKADTDIFSLAKASINPVLEPV